MRTPRRVLKGDTLLISNGLLVLTVLGSGLAIGGMLPGLFLIAASTGIASAILALMSMKSLARRRIAGPAIVAAVLSGYTLLQALPLPFSLLAAIAPGNADVWGRALLPMGEGPPGWASLSMDPGASVLEALKWITYAAVFVAGAAVGARRGAGTGAALVFVSAVTLALVTIAHGLLDASRVFGIYEPKFGPSRWHIGPLLNPNNLAGYLNLGVLCGLGLLVKRDPPAPRWTLGIGIAAALAAIVIAGSRGGVAALFFGLLVFAVLLLKFSRGHGSRGLASRATNAVTLGLVFAGAVILIALGATHQTSAELYNESLEKVDMMTWATPMVKDHPWFGIGRGAFESVFPAYRIGSDNIVYSHPENFVAQWISEWGIPVGVVALLAFAFMLRPSKLGTHRSASVIGIAAGIAALLLQNLLDLALEVPAVSIAAFTALGACYGHGSRSSIADDDGRGLPLKKAIIAGAAAASALILAMLFGLRPVADDRAAIQQALGATKLADAGARTALRAELRASMRRHPAEPYFSRIGAVLAWRAGDQSPMPWIQRSLERAMASGRTHYLLARILGSKGHTKQALLELQFAAQYDPWLRPRVGAESVALTKDYAELLRVAPEGADGASVLFGMASTLHKNDDRALRARLLHESLARDPRHVDARVVVANDLIKALETKSSPCVGEGERQQCERRVDEQAEQIARIDPSRSQPVELRARVRHASGNTLEAERILAQGCPALKPAQRENCDRLRVSFAFALDAPEKISSAVKDLLAVCTSGSHCARIKTWIGDLYGQRNEWAHAWALYEKAIEEEPSDERWLKLANAASKAGAHSRAADALGRLARKQGSDPQLRRRLIEEQERAFRQSAPP